jgi:uncharacterized protein YecE (DUF72 family)
VTASIKVGCCGWGYFREKDFSKFIEQTFRSKLQAYAQLFDGVEVNSTFYRIPKIATAEKWRAEADEMNKSFEFTVKASKIITHVDRFASQTSLQAFSQMLDVCAALRAKILLFQSPESFRPTPENKRRIEKFLSQVAQKGLTLTWEPRGTWWDDEQEIQKVCNRFGVICCVDPFRHEPLLITGVKTAYFRLHGFGKPSMYMYRFSEEELTTLKQKVQSLSRLLRVFYIFFNNAFMYENAREFNSFLTSVS